MASLPLRKSSTPRLQRHLHVTFFIFMLLHVLLLVANKSYASSYYDNGQTGGRGSSSSSSSSSSTMTSPIRHLEPSLAASSAQGTAVAVWSYCCSEEEDEEGEECVVIVTRSPLPRSDGDVRSSLSSTRTSLHGDGLTLSAFEASIAAAEEEEAAASDVSSSSSLSAAELPGRVTAGPSNEKKDDSGEETSKAAFGIETQPKSQQPTMLLPIALPTLLGPIPLPSSSSNLQSFHKSRILSLLSPTILCATTGFASDVRHLVRYCAKSTSSHDLLLYNTDMSIHKLVQDVFAERMKNVAFVSGGRPFGVQALLIGMSNTNVGAAASARAGQQGRRVATGKNTKTSRKTPKKLHMYTIDPTGGWKYYGGGATAVGKNADVVRKRLYSLLYETPVRPPPPPAMVSAPAVGSNDTAAMSSETITTSDKHGLEKDDFVAVSCPNGPRDALDIAMRALIEATEDMEDIEANYDDDEISEQGKSTSVTKPIPSARYDAVVVFSGGARVGRRGGEGGRQRRRRKRGKNQCRFAAVHPQHVTDSYWKCIRQILREKKTS